MTKAAVPLIEVAAHGDVGQEAGVTLWVDTSYTRPARLAAGPAKKPAM